MKRYKSIPVLTNNSRTRYYASTKYPTTPLSFEDIYVITQEEDRFDNLEFQYYRDSTLWWAISSANPNLPQSSYYPGAGIQIRIPANITGLISNFERVNNRNASLNNY